jgi:itaconyl-CoA hydratase
VPDVSALDVSAFPTRSRGHAFEDFEVGRVFEHHWGRTITEADTVLFSTLTLSYNPLYFNAEHARRCGHPAIVVNPMLVFTTVLGLSVEDLSEAGGPFLGVDELAFHEPVHPGDTLSARSEVVAARPSESRPGTGIVTWRTEGRNQRDELVVDFRRSNLVFMRGG